MTDFNKIIYEHQDVITTFRGKKITLLNMQTYNGPITMQYLPCGGIQSIFNNYIIINTLKGFMFCDTIMIDNEKISSKKFIELFGNIVNEVLPN